MEKVYLTTAIPYVNGTPHIGHAMDYCLADVAARYNRMMGREVRISAGTDEHGGKIFQKAAELGIPVTEYVAENAQKFQDFIHKLGAGYTDFVRTTDPEHERRCQEIWRKLRDHIYLGKYEGWYCTGCERFITDKEYEENHGVCPDHQKPYERLEEENYYFRISDFKEQIEKAINSGEMVILPEFRKKEILRLLADSPDVSISRPREQLEWGVAVPDDPGQVMYVWIDALANYITVLGYPDQDITEWWPATAEFVGKDILRFHAIIWPAMLYGLGLALPKTLVSHGMVLSNGQKMSKSIGNVVDPSEVIDKYGVDAFRYFFLRHIDTFADSDFTWEKFETAYRNELANDLGNLVQRLAKLAENNNFVLRQVFEKKIPEEYRELMENYEYSKAFDYTWSKLQGLNRKIDEEKPWALVKEGRTEELEKCLFELISELVETNYLISPFLPQAAEKIAEIFESGAIKTPETPLFPKN